VIESEPAVTLNYDTVATVSAADRRHRVTEITRLLAMGI